MSRIRYAAIFSFAGVVLVSFALIQSAPSPAEAQTQTLAPQSCDQIFGLATTTIETAASSAYLNASVCGAYQDLISRYNPGACSKEGLANPQVQGITSLNPQFAVNLDTMLKAADQAGYHITIVSAFRTLQAQSCANPNGFNGDANSSMHTKGLAADLIYPGDSNSAKDCDSGTKTPAYLWVQQNDSTYKVGSYDQLHSFVSGECNHVEATSGSITTPTSPSVASIISQYYTSPSGSAAVASQYFCSGANLMYLNSSGSMQVAQTCPYGCVNNQCLNSSGVPLQQPAITAPGTLPSVQPTLAPSSAAVPQTTTGAGATQCTPQFSCVNNTIYFQSSSCTNQVYQTCQYGCTGTVCTASSSQPSSGSNSLSSGSQTSAAPASSPSVLQEFPTPILTATSTASTSNIYTLVPAQNSTSSEASSPNYEAQQIGVEQTFTSEDLDQSGQSAQGSYAPESSSPLAAILDRIRTILAGLLAYFSPTK